jgi:hypothetical protein
MLRTVFTIGLFAVLGWILLQVALGLVGGLLVVFLHLLWFAVRGRVRRPGDLRHRAPRQPGHGTPVARALLGARLSRHGALGRSRAP